MSDSSEQSYQRGDEVTVSDLPESRHPITVDIVFHTGALQIKDKTGAFGFVSADDVDDVVSPVVEQPELVTDGGVPAFLDPQTDWVECFICGQHIEDMSRVGGMDLSDPDEYYPKMVPVCPSHEEDDDG